MIALFVFVMFRSIVNILRLILSVWKTNGPMTRSAAYKEHQLDFIGSNQEVQAVINIVLDDFEQIGCFLKRFIASWV